ncbi:MAG: hypothetical protein MI807_05705 [Verrucomicrobiales bacterium]|nr:hypothetical protein [Verrucomicrobiales bacterium]
MMAAYSYVSIAGNLIQVTLNPVNIVVHTGDIALQMARSICGIMRQIVNVRRFAPQAPDRPYKRAVFRYSPVMSPKFIFQVINRIFQRMGQANNLLVPP